MSSALLGYLERIDDNGGECCQYGIHEGEEIFIGRDRRSCQIVLDDITISNRHLRIYSVIYDPNVPDIEPFVYAVDISTNGCQWVPKIQGSKKPYPMGKSNAILLSDGDRILLSDGTLFKFVSCSSARKPPQIVELNEIQELEKDCFNNLYIVTDRKLGAGGTGQVFMAMDVWSQCQVACKIVNLIKPTRKQAGEQRQLRVTLETGWQIKLWREVELLKHISHPNIITVKRVFYTEHNLYIIEDLITGGDLVSYIEHKGGSLNEPDACITVYQLLQAVQYLHGESIIHRDIKPENILMSPSTVGPRVILTDFGGAIKEVGHGYRPKRMQTICGTLDFVAPEVRGENRTVNQAGYTKAVDMWSVGCVTTALLAGKSYFVNTQDSDYRRNSSAAIIKAAAECNMDRLDNSLAWLGVNQQAKGLVKELLVLDETVRLTAQQALQHLWFTEGSRGVSIGETYKKTLEGWRPWSPGWDFHTHLDCFIEARIPQNDPRRRVLSPQAKEDIAKASYQLQSQLPEQLSGSSIQNTPYVCNVRGKQLDAKDLSHSTKHQELMGGTRPAITQTKRQSIQLSTNEFAIYTELEHHYRPWEPVLEERLCSNRDNQVLSSCIVDTPRESSAYLHTAVRTTPEERGEISPTKMRRTTIYDYEDAAIHTEAGKENRGFVSAKTYSKTIAKKRSERAVKRY